MKHYLNGIRCSCCRYFIDEGQLLYVCMKYAQNRRNIEISVPTYVQLHTHRTRLSFFPCSIILYIERYLFELSTQTFFFLLSFLVIVDVVQYRRTQSDLSSPLEKSDNTVNILYTNTGGNIMSIIGYNHSTEESVERKKWLHDFD